MTEYRTNIPGQRVPFLDERTGLLTREWYQFFATLFNATELGTGGDGDKGDITVSGGGSVWTIDNGAVDTAKLGGDITPAGKTLLNDSDAAEQRATLGLGTLATMDDGDFVYRSGDTITGWLNVNEYLVGKSSITLNLTGQATDGAMIVTVDDTYNAYYSSVINDVMRSAVGYHGTDDVFTVRLYDIEGLNEEIGLTASYDGAVSLYYDDAVRLETTTTGTTITGDVLLNQYGTGSGAVMDLWGDDYQASGIRVLISTGIAERASLRWVDLTSLWQLRAYDGTGASAETMIRALYNGAVELYHAGSKTVETSATGATVTGTLDATTNLTVNGTAVSLEGHRHVAVQSVTSAATVTPDADNDDIVIVTSQAEGMTLANPNGTPVQGQRLVVRVKDNGTSRSIAYGSEYRAIGVTLPTATTISKTLYLGFMRNATDGKWDGIAVAEEA